MIKDPIKKEFPHNIIKRYKNRYGDEYWFEQIDKDVYKIMGDLTHWRFGGKDNEVGVNEDDLGFVDPSGGPFISIGSELPIGKVKTISSNENGIFLKIE